MVSVSVSKQQQQITSHEQLRSQYLRAKRKGGSKLYITFVNTDVAGHPFDKQSDRDWTEYGVWTDRYQGGWAGGAKSKRSIGLMAKKISIERESSVAKNRTAARMENDTSSPDKSATLDLGGLSDNSRWVSKGTRFDPTHRNEIRKEIHSRGIVNGRSEPKGKCSVRFSDAESVKYFVVGTPVTEWFVPSHTLPNNVPNNRIDGRKLPPLDNIEDAVKNHSCTELISVLESAGSTSDFDVVNTALHAQHEYSKV